MSSTNTDVIILSTIMNQVSSSISIFTILIGIVGGICNFITYTAPQFRRNACILYLLWANTFQMISILLPVTIRILVAYLGDGLESQSLVFCKFRYFIGFNVPHLATLYMLLSILDRFLATSRHAKLRAWSERKIAQYFSLGIFFFTNIFNMHILIFQGIYDDKCQIILNNGYEIYFAIHIVFFISIVPHSIMLILCLLTFFHVKNIKSRVVPTGVNSRNSLMKRFESQLITILITQAIIGTAFILLRVGSYSYTLLTRSKSNKSNVELIIENTTLQLGVAFYYFNFAMAFYISIATSKYVREIFVKRIIEIKHRCCAQC